MKRFLFFGLIGKRSWNVYNYKYQVSIWLSYWLDQASLIACLAEVRKKVECCEALNQVYSRKRVTQLPGLHLQESEIADHSQQVAPIGGGGLLLCRDSVGIFWSPSQQSDWILEDWQCVIWSVIVPVVSGLW